MFGDRLRLSTTGTLRGQGKPERRSVMKVPFKSLVFTILIILIGCSTKVVPPPRAAGIPLDAVWVGGADGGAWFKSQQQGQFYYCQVYNDQTGKVWAEGLFKATGNLQKMPKGNLNYEGFDGEGIQLEDGIYLEPIKGQVKYPVPKVK